LRGHEALRDLTVIIVSYNDEIFLYDCLDSLRETVDGVDFDVIIIKNDSEPVDLKKTGDLREKVTVIQSGSNIGFARGVNMGLKNTESRYVMLLNTDTKLCPESVTRMYDFMEKNKDAGLCGPRLLNADGSLQLSCKATLRPPGAMLKNAALNLVWPDNGITDRHLISKKAHMSTHDVDCLKGACLFIRRRVLEQVGNMDERFFMFGEEFDLCLRVRKAGWRIVYLSRAGVIHYGGGSSKKTYKEDAVDYDLERFKSLFKFYKKHYGRKGFGLFKIISVIEIFSDLRRVVNSPERSKILSVKLKLAKKVSRMGYKNI
jgi:hypothetical protein